MSRKITAKFIFLLLIVAVALAGAASGQAEASWEDILKKARGQRVDWFMYGGFPAANTFVNAFVAPRMKELYGVEVRQTPVRDIAEVISRLLVEQKAGRLTGGEADLLWINGENFRTAKRLGLLFGPFSRRLPNQRLVNWDSPAVANDFGEPVEGLESPWGSAQVVMIYDAARVGQPPATMAGLLEWIKGHPGRFAYPAPPDFTGSVFVRHVFYHASGGADRWQGAFTPDELEQAAEKTFALLEGLAPFLWRGGRTYPESPVRLLNLLADGEVDFAISYHPAEASRMILDGLLPPSVRTFVFEEGTIANTHFVAIPANAQDKEGAMVLADFLLSPEAQLKKADPKVWGDLPAIDATRLDRAWRARFAGLERGPATLSDETLALHRLPEPPAKVLIHLENGWRERVLKGR